MSTMAALRARFVRWTYPYTLVAAGTFLLGAILGAVAVATTPSAALTDLTEAFGNPDLFPDRLTTWTVFRNNVVVLGLIAVGTVTFAATTVVVLLFNGFIFGVVAATAADRPLALVALVAPHGVFELGTFFIVSGVAYRTTWRLVSYLRGADDTPVTRQEILEAVVLIVGAVLVIALAAWIEATLTRRIARLLVGDPL